MRSDTPTYTRRAFQDKGSKATGVAPAGEACASAGASVKVLATYAFKYGIRRFQLRDQFWIRDGRIVRLRRLRG